MNTKKLKVVLLILFLVMAFTIPSNAAADYQVGLSLDKQIIHPGDTIKVTVSMNNINVPEGLGTFMGKIVYDSDVFETLAEENITAMTGWGTPVYSPESGYVVVETASGNGITENTNVLQITLKVKENAPIGSTTVEISDSSSSNGEDDFIADAATLAVPISAQSPVTGGNGTVNNGTTNDVPNGTGSNGVINNATVRNNTTTRNNTNTSATGTSLPHAGSNDYIMPAIIVLLVIATLSYIGYRKNK